MLSRGKFIIHLEFVFYRFFFLSLSVRISIPLSFISLLYHVSFTWRLVLFDKIPCNFDEVSVFRSIQSTAGKSGKAIH